MDIKSSIYKRLIPLWNIYKLLQFRKKKILVINAASGFGDYLWARYYFDLFKEKYKNHVFILIGTNRWIDFAKYHDRDIFDLFIKVSHLSRVKNMKWQLSCFNFVNADIFINIMPAWTSIKQSVKCLEYYELPRDINSYREGISEFCKNFFDIPVDYKYKYKEQPNLINGQTDYIIIVLGGFDMGQFSASQIIQIIDYITHIYNKNKILLLGDDKDVGLCHEILKQTKHTDRIIDGCDKFKIQHLFGIVQNALFVITPNTSIYHICILLNKKCICASINRFNTLELKNNNAIYILNTDENSAVKKISEFDIKYFINAIDKLNTEMKIIQSK